VLSGDERDSTPYGTQPRVGVKHICGNNYGMLVCGMLGWVG
jgi:hypothetical protein